MRTLTPRGRFWRWVLFDEPDRCWKWLGQYNEKGYGRLDVRGLPKRAHRAAWELMRGPIPKGMFVLHRCDSPPCVNPRHLFLGTQRDNWADAVAKGRCGIGADGEQSVRAKITKEQAQGIIDARGPVKELAAKYGITTMHVYNIKHGRYWKSLHKA